MFPDDVNDLARAVLELARSLDAKLATAESCTGGLVAGALTAVAGSSDVVEGGLMTYSNATKIKFLGINPSLLDQFGAVSQPVARAMAEGAIRALDADFAVAITGVAGPGGGSAEKPVGLVHFAIGAREGVTLHREMRFGDIGRSEVRMASVRTALQMLQARLAP